MQNVIKFNDVDIVQPDTYTAALATTSSEDSGRDMSFTMRNTPIGTAESFKLEWNNISAIDAANILKQVVGKSKFKAHYLSLYEGKWKDAEFYSANYNTPVITVIDGVECWEKLTFQITGVDSIL